MSREVAELWSDAIGAAGTVIRYGHWGRAVLVFPTERGRACDFENNGMLGAVGGLVEAGRLKVYCVDSYHAGSWSNRDAPLEERARGHGHYDPASWRGWGERGMAAYFNNPMDYVGHLEGGHLDWLRSRVNLLLVCGQGQWEDTTGSLLSTRQFAGLLAGKGIRHELDLWGHDVPHDWPSWRAQVAHHMPRFC